MVHWSLVLLEVYLMKNEHERNEIKIESIIKDINEPRWRNINTTPSTSSQLNATYIPMSSSPMKRKQSNGIRTRAYRDGRVAMGITRNTRSFAEQRMKKITRSTAVAFVTVCRQKPPRNRLESAIKDLTEPRRRNVNTTLTTADHK